MSVPITKPTVDGSNGTWGDELNTALDAMNAADYFAYKTADTARSSTTTNADDAHLVLPSMPAGTYVVNSMYLASGTLAGSFKAAWAFTGTATGYRGGNGPSLRTTDASGAAAAATTVGVNRATASNGTSGGFTSSSAYGTDSAANNWSYITETGVVVVTVAGILKVQWSQSSSSATATTLRAGSYLWARQVA